MDSKNFYLEKTDPWSSHTRIYEWLKKFSSGTKILDIGTATGIIGKKCVDSGFYLKGIEPVIEWAHEAKPYYDELLYLTLDQAPDEFLENQDVVVCADVLEHTMNPKELLSRLIELQNTDTQFIISIPNIAHIWIRLNLLIGKFEYTDYGILDKTHLRFFTKSTFLKLIESCGLVPTENAYTPVPLGRIHPFFQSNSMGRFIQRIFNVAANFLPSLFAYQFVTLAEIKYND